VLPDPVLQHLWNSVIAGVRRRGEYNV
jgi:hypothetical protein